jgi:SAM-dependent methyltransferase
MNTEIERPRSLVLRQPTSPLLPDRVSSYDWGAWLYDWIVGSDFYHRIVWGMPVLEHQNFAQRALTTSPPGPILDAGCGSLLFTAKAYAETQRALTCLDASRGMLMRARRRLGPAPHVTWACADLYALPLPMQSVSSVFHFGVFHCLENPERALSEQHRVLAPHGRLFLSCLVLGRPRGDAFLKRLCRAGHIATPRSTQQVQQLITDAGFDIEKASTFGSFCFVEATRRT